MSKEFVFSGLSYIYKITQAQPWEKNRDTDDIEHIQNRTLSTEIKY